jgi:lipoprotein-anchoring transpeptidase ErfK/SrfK
MSKALVSSLVLFVALAFANAASGSPTGPKKPPLQLPVSQLAQATSAISAAHAPNGCGALSEENVRSGPTPGSWYRITSADQAAAKSSGQTIMEQVFGANAENVLRATRLDGEWIVPRIFVCVPIMPAGATVWTPLPSTYAPARGHAKFILVNLEEQFLGAYEDGRLVASFPVSTSKYRSGKITPVGEFQVLGKDWNHQSSVYQLPDGRPCPMPHALKFYQTKRRGGGAMWAHQGTLPGRPASHGCVRLGDKTSQWLYKWAAVGTPFHVVPSLK